MVAAGVVGCLRAIVTVVIRGLWGLVVVVVLGRVVLALRVLVALGVVVLVVGRLGRLRGLDRLGRLCRLDRLRALCWLGCLIGLERVGPTGNAIDARTAGVDWWSWLAPGVG